jgi:UPF0716 protein FxsA
MVRQGSRELQYSRAPIDILLEIRVIAPTPVKHSGETSYMRVVILLLPWLELFTLIELGIKTSALTAIAYVFVTLFIGLAILRRQGMGMFERLRQGQDGRILGPELFLDDMAMGFAGLLLMIPGIITDLLALIVMVGPLRRTLARAVLGPQSVVRTSERSVGPHETIEGVYRHVDDDKTP